MKKYFYLLSFCFIAFGSLRAQVNRWDVDAFVGFASTWFDHEGFQNRQGTDVKLGVMAKYGFTGAWSINSGLSYLRKHMSGRESIPDVGGPVEYQALRYLQVPLAVGYTVRVRRNFSCMPEVGVAMDYGMSGRIMNFSMAGLSGNGTDNSLNVRAFSAKEGALLRPLHRVDWSLMVGLHLKYRRFGVKASYQHGLTDLKGVYPYGTKTRTFNLGATYTLFR